MSCYISSRQNRIYGAQEARYGEPAAVTAENRLQAVRLSIREESEVPRRRDKTGSRTVANTSGRLRKQVDYDLELYHSDKSGARHPLGMLVQAALGGTPKISTAGMATLAQGGKRLVFSTPHGLSAYQAVATNSEIRFVESLPSDTAAVLNAPIAGVEGQQVEVRAAESYGPGVNLPSFTLYDYWPSNGGVHRMLRGAAVDTMEIEVAGDFHTIRLSGPAAELLDSASFEAGQGGLLQYPETPTGTSYQTSPVPGHLGQIWIGAGPDRIYTLTRAKLRLENSLSMRNKEFGALYPACVVAGERTAGAEFELFAKGDEAYRALYQASRNRTPISVCFQLGDRPNQMCAVYLPTFVPEVPTFEDKDERQLWSFGLSKAYGTGEDEIHVAFA